jgi:aspartyl-tRNA(Asn)/glutamyl-tRNA(Gln) amidotransferase subunit A
MADELHFQSVAELSRLIRTRQVSPVELTRTYLDRADRMDRVPFPLPADHSVATGGQLASIITLVREGAIAAAQTAEREIVAGTVRSPLHGIPYGVKDLLDTEGIRTTWGSRIFMDRVPTRDANVVARLKRSGAVLMAKMSMAEFAGGNTSTARNPWKLDRSSMGSSSGTVVATVAGLIGFGIGSETGGSIVLPAATVGATGLRPTFGRVGRSGCMALSWSLDKLGPVGRSAVDCGLVLEAIAGYDADDVSSLDRPFQFRAEPSSLRGKRIAIHRPEFDGIDNPFNRRLFDGALDVFRQQGVVFEDVQLPADRPYGDIFGNITNVESATSFRNLFEDQRIDGMFPYNWSRRAGWLAASMAPASDYLTAQRIRQIIIRETDALMSRYDAIVAPTYVNGAPLRDAPVQPPVPPPPSGNPNGRGIPRINSIGNLVGLPGLNLPIGFDQEGMPLCMQIVGPAWQDQGVLDFAMAFQRDTDWHLRRPAYPFRP